MRRVMRRVNYIAAIAALAAVAVRPDWTCLDEVDVPVRQGALSHAIDEALYQNLLSTAPSIRSRALALSSGLPHAGDWLNVVPSSPLGLHLHDKEFCSYLCYWLGIPYPSDPATSTKHLFSRVSVVLWRGNACSWLHRAPFTPTSIDGYS